MLSKLFHKLIIVALVLVAGLLLKDCIGKHIPTEPRGDERLKDNEKERIAINDRGDVVHTKRRKDGNSSVQQVAFRDTGAGKTIITLDDKGNISVKQETRGFVFRPGLCLATSGEGLLVGADIQFYYFRNFGANVGLTSTARENLGENFRAHISGSYRLPFESFRNTAVYVGFDTKKEIQVGIRLRF